MYLLRRNVLKIVQLWNLSYEIYSFNLMMLSEAIISLLYTCATASRIVGLELGHVFGGVSTHIKKV